MKSRFIAVGLCLAALTPTTFANQGLSPTSAGQTLAAGPGLTIVETAVAAGNFKSLVRALNQAGLADDLSSPGPFTVFAPTDQAFAALPPAALASLFSPAGADALTTVLTYHVVAGDVPATQVLSSSFLVTLNGQRIDIATGPGGPTVDGAGLVTTDIVCSNGIIHVIDAVLLPATADVLETAYVNGNFDTLVLALRTAAVVAALDNASPVTVFAPTDQAFAALPPALLNALLLPANRDRLINILLYHVVPGRVYSDQLTTGQVATLQGSTVAVVVGTTITVGGATVVTADVEATNGVIHVINAVLLPPG